MERFKVKASGLASALTNRFVLTAFILAAVVLAGFGHVSHASDGTGATTSSNVAVATSYAEVVSRVAPAVVTIRSERRTREAQQFPFGDDPFLRDLFRNRAPQAQPAPQIRRALGSGVVVSADGYILTNHHVVDGAEEIKVELQDNRTFDAKVIGTDQPSDLAVLKVDAHDLPVLPLGNSDNVRVGDVALAVGNPLGVGQTVTAGIISAKGRSTGLSDGSFEDFLQTDAAINQGNSGGALVNTNGELVGINSQILSPSGGNIGIGFSIPSNMARNVMEQLIRTGKVRRGQLGVVVQPLTADMAASLDLNDAHGLIVSNVAPDSAAARGGLKRGDIITALNGTAVNDSNSFRNRIASTQPGTEVTLSLLRDGREQQLRVALGELKVAAAKTENDEAGDEAARNGGKLGIAVEPLTPETAARLKLGADARGLVITSIDAAGAAAEAGLQRNDVIEEANRQPVRSVADLTNAVTRAGARPLLLLVNRGGDSVFVTVRPRR